MYSKNLATNYNAASGLTGWTTSNVIVESTDFKLQAGAASMSQSRTVSTLDFKVKGFKLYVKFTRVAISGNIVDFAYLRVNYTIGYDIIQIPLRGVGTNEVSFSMACSGEATTVVIGVDKASASVIYIDELSYFHDDNPFAFEEAEADKPDNSIITDAYGIHIYDGNAFEGGTRRVSLGEYDLNQFGLLIRGANAETIINEFGINPKFLDYSKNLIWNSSFEVYNIVTNKPLYWTVSGTGRSSGASSFYSSRSLKLGPTEFARQIWAARVKPWFIDNQAVRVSMYVNFAQDIEVRVVDIGTWEASGGIVVNYYTLTKDDGTTGTTLGFTGSAGWEGSRITFTFDSGQWPSVPPPGEDTIAFGLEITNVDSGDVYIDGVMAHVDFTSQWPQLYKDGPRSVGIQQVGNFYTNPGALDPVESVYTGGTTEPPTDLSIYDDGMIVTFQDGYVGDYTFTLDLGEIVAIINNNTGVTTVINDIGGAKP